MVAGVEVSTDGGTHVASGHAHDGRPTPRSAGPTPGSRTATRSTTIKSRAVDDSGNLETPAAGMTVNVACPCSIWGTGATPPDSRLGRRATRSRSGVKFTSEVVRHDHRRPLLQGRRQHRHPRRQPVDADRQLLAQATFTNETASGWQQVNFSSPVTITADTTYVAGYFAPNGHYSETQYYFYSPPAPTAATCSTARRCTRVPASRTTTNGLYAYASEPDVPDQHASTPPTTGSTRSSRRSPARRAGHAASTRPPARAPRP